MRNHYCIFDAYIISENPTCSMSKKSIVIDTLVIRQIQRWRELF